MLVKSISLCKSSPCLKLSQCNLLIYVYYICKFLPRQVPSYSDSNLLFCMHNVVSGRQSVGGPCWRIYGKTAGICHHRIRPGNRHRRALCALKFPQNVMTRKLYPHYWHLYSGNPLVKGGFPSQISHAELWCFLCCPHRLLCDVTVMFMKSYDLHDRASDLFKHCVAVSLALNYVPG